MIGAFIGGFITGGLVTFILLVIMAICSLNSKRRKLKVASEVLSSAYMGKINLAPYAKPFDYKDLKKDGVK